MTKNIYGERDVVRFKQKHCNNFKERRKKRNWKRTRVRLYSPGNASRKIMRVEENGRETGDIYTWANYPASRAGIFSSSKLDDNSSAGGSWIPGYHSRVTMVSPSPFHPFSLSLSLSLSPRCSDTMKTETLSLAFTSMLVFYRSNKAEADDLVDSAEGRHGNDDSTRKKNEGNRICRNRYNGATERYVAARTRRCATSMN